MIPTLQPTALITGASAGLGAEFARQLAEKGYHLALTARRLDRLEALASELQQQYNIQAQVLAADLAVESGVARIESWIAELSSLDMLVNNAGYGLRGSFAASPVEKQLTMIQIHVLAAVRLAHAALQSMLRLKHGAIINVASMAAFVPIRNTMYTSTKAFLVNFSKSLQSELWGSGIKVQALVPGYVHTEFHDTPEFAGYNKSKIPDFFWLDAPEVVSRSLHDLEKGKVECIPGWQYQAAASLLRFPLTSSLAQAYVRRLHTRRAR